MLVGIKNIKLFPYAFCVSITNRYMTSSLQNKEPREMNYERYVHQRCQKMEIKTFVLFDTETTGFADPSITEISMIAYRRKDLVEATKESPFPRVMSKILFQLNPAKRIDDGATKISGLSNQILEDLKTFDSDIGNLLNSFLNQLNKPICIVAHNGLRFDFPILRRHLDEINITLDDDIFCVDSLTFFRSADKGYQKYTLNEIYKRHCGSFPVQSHHAESDVLNLIECVVSMKKEFINYTNDPDNLIKFNDIS